MSLETLNVGYDDSSEERDYKLMKSPGVVKLLKNCLASSKCDIAQPAKCQCRSCLYTKYGHVVFVPHDAHQDGEEGPGEKCAECISVEGTVRGQYAGEYFEIRHWLSIDLTYSSRDLRPLTPFA